MSPIAASLIASAGLLMKWNVSFVNCFVWVSVAISMANVGLRGNFNAPEPKDDAFQQS